MTTKIHRHHRWPKGLCAAVLAIAALVDIAHGAAAEYVIVGDVGEAVDSGEVILARSGAAPGSSHELARAPITAGRFRIVGEVADNIGVVSLTAEDPAGNTKGAARFILEPGEIRIRHVNPVAGFAADGGPYNQRVIGSWQESDEYQRALADYADVMAAKADLEPGPEQDALMAEAVEVRNGLTRIRGGALRNIALADDDPLASFLAVAMGGLSGTQALERLDELEAITQLPASADALRSRNETLSRISANTRFIKSGDKVDAFAAAGLDGDTYGLKDTLAKNKLVLIEFWASWCGPCRADVPNLKAAVEEYGDRGFAIFAFSLDTDREDWNDASVEDGINWINTCDLKGYDSPISQQYGVNMLPKNLLVDANGVVVEVHARGERLVERLSEMLGDGG
ncbi:MAG: TlpA family protein disulfide reductase [Gammaproteobacteria bacterium]|nr:TlpA family protein disulfide reductase [Gammaproteobacteria bacterium]